jgi:hypothetical protein
LVGPVLAVSQAVVLAGMSRHDARTVDVRPVMKVVAPCELAEFVQV